MKTLVTLGIALAMTACAPMMSLEELEAEALTTGDWTKVEERERIIAKREARRPKKCAAGTVSYCQREVGHLECYCLTRSAVSDIFAATR